ncbi:hypothetical protein BGW80DRAFT_1165130 [Lactifluus volemus]|nr:hypothetical protein BGW80DRAFT_1165130 [Lactifluus volemus]
MVSYANIAAKNVPPREQQPHPDPSLLITPSSLGGVSQDGNSKVTVVHAHSREPSTSITSESANRLFESTNEDRTRKQPDAQTPRLWEKLKCNILRPSVAGASLVNISLLAGASYALYAPPRLRRDTKVITTALVAAVMLFGAETYATEACQSTARCRAAERESRDIEHRSANYRRAHEYALRPRVIGRIFGLGESSVLRFMELKMISWRAVNIGILSTYLAYLHWK